MPQLNSVLGKLIDCSKHSDMMSSLQAVVVDFQDHHSCPVCLDLLYEPFKCSCGHVFCEPCLRQLNFSVNTRTLRCPLCRQIVKHVLPATGTVLSKEESLIL